MYIYLSFASNILLFLLLKCFNYINCLHSRILMEQPLAFHSIVTTNIPYISPNNITKDKYMNKSENFIVNSEPPDDLYDDFSSSGDDDSKCILTGIEAHVQLASPYKAFCSCRSIASPLTTLNATNNPDLYKTLPADNRRKVYNGFKEVLEEISSNYKPSISASKTHYNPTAPLNFEQYAKFYYESTEFKDYGDVDEKTLNEMLSKENEYTCPVCKGEVGATPYISPMSFLYAVGVCKVFNCKISNNVSFDRKCYEYFDLPKGYQITQTLNPLGRDGSIKLSTGKVVTVSKVQFEEDTARRVDVHGTTKTLDFNRSGVALAEVVTAPLEMTRLEILETCRKIYELVFLNGLSNGNRFRGNFRFDINLSRPDGTNRVEVKNLNSFVTINKAINDYDPEKDYSFNFENFNNPSVLTKLVSEEQKNPENKSESILETIKNVFLSILKHIPDSDKYTPMGTTLKWNKHKGLEPTRSKLPSDCYGNYFEPNIPVIYQSDDLIKRITDCLPKSVKGLQSLLEKYPEVNKELLKEIYKYASWTEYYEKLCTYLDSRVAASHFVNLLLPVVKFSNKPLMSPERFSELLKLVLNYKLNLSDVEVELPRLLDYTGSFEDYFRSRNLLLYDLDKTKKLIDEYLKEHPLDYSMSKNPGYVARLTTNLVRSLDSKVSYQFVKECITNMLKK
ncbi:GatB/GatE catalytic domain protein [Theileria parva strain Muguga]|uniref:Glutamyl-tRNA amidotransferase subunit B, putative n=1 Tax=Theileria parva TaxID=5875 RepID=Q4N9T3_THEPA|nr:GatB/GatE catalytic domain protein [Theileria parva strain Muguga]EAN33275.1 GatB/GatE catalytic domain protein [Theileria parva strain Muguga]|eukprot:XP_765558.1 glutamyl-tRNA amidotransferase subunit B [Theileria parva strain Muguga]